jgi:SAM-dependent methyltransferase
MLRGRVTVNKEIVNFSFGENWLNFIKDFDKEKYLRVKQSMADMLGTSLQGKTFIDIGCGSGVFSLAAIELRAKSVLSVDVDPKSVLACKKIMETGNSEKWQVLQKSILDDEFLREAGRFDIVYSWGVLHHTGNMWKAIDNASDLTGNNGLFMIAIYNKTVTSKFWLYFKRLYNRQNPGFTRKLMVWFILLPRLIVRFLKMEDPFNVKRGMSLYYDAVDWAGGLPYEYAGFEEIVTYMEKKGFELIKYKKTKGTGCNEFLFVKK